MSTTTISIDKDVRDRLKRCGAKDESYTSIIERLLDLYEEFDLDQYIEKQYQKLKKDKEKFISLEQYEMRVGKNRFEYFVKENCIWVVSGFRRGKGYK